MNVRLTPWQSLSCIGKASQREARACVQERHHSWAFRGFTQYLLTLPSEDPEVVSLQLLKKFMRQYPRDNAARPRYFAWPPRQANNLHSRSRTQGKPHPSLTAPLLCPGAQCTRGQRRAGHTAHSWFDLDQQCYSQMLNARVHTSHTTNVDVPGSASEIAEKVAEHHSLPT